jgi:tetratricopeptide (TPR) repeat protein
MIEAVTKGLALFLILLTYQMPSSHAQANIEPDYTKICLDEPTKERPDMESVFEECSLAGKYYRDRGNIGNASWIYTINGQWDEAKELTDEREILDDLSVLYMNQGHIAAMEGNYTKAKELYQKHIVHNSRPIGEGFEDDLENILPKIFPTHKKQIKTANKIWLSLYEPIAEIDKLYAKLSDLLQERDFKNSKKLIEKIQQVRDKNGLRNTFGSYHNAMRLSDINEVSGNFSEATETNQTLISNLQKQQNKDPDAVNWMLNNSYVNLGRLALRERRYDDAYEAFEISKSFPVKESYLTDANEKWNTDFAIASILAAKGDKDDAMAALLTTIDKIDLSTQKDSEVRKARFHQALANLHAQDRDYDGAIEILQTLLKNQQTQENSSPLDIAYSFFGLAKVYAKDHQYQKAIANYTNAIDIVQNNYGEQNSVTLKFVRNYAHLLNALGDNKALLELYDEFNLDPNEFIGKEQTI